jgi:hypothetical protein
LIENNLQIWNAHETNDSTTRIQKTINMAKQKYNSDPVEYKEDSGILGETNYKNKITVVLIGTRFSL